MLQLIINKCLSLDPGLTRHLQQLEGKNLAIICTDMPAQSMYCVFANGQINLSSSAPQEIDVTIQGTVRSFLHYAVTKQRAGITISGDATVAATVEKLYSQLDINWEEELSKFTGDAIAHQAIYSLRQIKQFGRDTSSSLGAMVTEYLQEESKLLPTAYEVESFMQDVDELRLRVDRLEARIKAYESD